MPTKELYLVCGPGAAGKTTFADYLRQETGYPIVENDAVRDESDEIMELFWDMWDPKLVDGYLQEKLDGRFRGLRRTFKTDFIEYMRSSSSENYYGARYDLIRLEVAHRIDDILRDNEGAILVGTYVNRKYRRDFTGPLVKEFDNDLDITAYWMATPLSECYRRFMERETAAGGERADAVRGYSHDSFLNHVRDAQLPSRYDKFSRVLFVTGDVGNYQMEESYSKVLE